MASQGSAKQNRQTDQSVSIQLVVQSPSFDVQRGRRVEIKEGAAEQKSSQPNQKT